MKERKISEIREMLLNDGINSSLVYKMTDDELRKADSYEDYEEYNHYMHYMVIKYHI